MIETATHQPATPYRKATFWRSQNVRNAAILLLIAIIYFARMPGAFTHPQFFGEDGIIFFDQAYIFGWKSLLTPYSGYIHLIPRIIAKLALYFPLEATQVIFTYSAITCLIATAAAILYSRLNRLTKCLFAISLISLPVSGAVFGTLTYIQCFAASLFYIMLTQAQPVNNKQRFFDYSCLSLLSLTGPYVCFMLPFFCMKYWRQRSNYSLYCLIPIVIGAYVQTYCYLISPRFSYTDHLLNFGIKVFAFRLVNPMLLWFHASQPFTLSSSSLLVIVFLLPIITCLFIAHRQQYPTFSLYTALLIAALLFLSGLTAQHHDLYFLPSHESRYFYLPTLLTAWFYIQMLSVNRAGRIIATIMLTLLLIGSIHHFRFFARTFDDQQHWQQTVRALKAHKKATIHTYPHIWTTTIDHNDWQFI